MSEQFNAIDIYKELGVSKDSSSQTVHKHFLKLVRSLLLKVKNGQDSSQLMDELRTLWIAHDILIDPDCRSDYDLRSLGITTSDTNEDDDIDSLVYSLGKGPKSKSPSWRIGELLQSAGLLEQAELRIAYDMHKAMPEIQFGRFLVKQGFLTENQLQAILIGQTLIRTGEITINQFINVMSKVNESNQNIKEVLLELAYIKNPILLKLDNDT